MGVRSNAKGRQAKSKARLNRFEEMQFHNVTKRFDEKLLYQDLSFTIPPGAIVGIVGGNGAGKSTLFKLVTGKEQPDAGEVVIGETVDIAYVEQLRDALDDK